MGSCAADSSARRATTAPAAAPRTATHLSCARRPSPAGNNARHAAVAPRPIAIPSPAHGRPPRPLEATARRSPRDIIVRPGRQGGRRSRSSGSLFFRAPARPAHDDGRRTASPSGSSSPRRATRARRMPSVEVVDLSRLQFAVTALYHFLFVPLTLGLSWILVIMESVYVMTGKRDLPRHDEVLGQALRHQLRDGRHHRHHDGVPVRHQLGVLTRTTSATSSARRWRSKG